GRQSTRLLPHLRSHPGSLSHLLGAIPLEADLSGRQRRRMRRLWAGRAMKIGQIEAIFRYPVKSMRGEPLEAATLGWHGIDGDRRFAFRRLEERGGMPWLTASKLPELVLFTPQRRDGEALPTDVRTPEGDVMPVFAEALAAEVERRHGAPVQMMQLNHG